MATALINNLYPPIMDTYMPAFDREKECKVYFSLSSFNDREDINDYAQVQIRYQQNNKSALNDEGFPAGIALLPIMLDGQNNQYYISFSKDILKNNRFELNVYYKVQIRFMTSQVEVPVTNDGIVIQQKYNWFNNTDNMIYFSEWSKICLIRGIATPVFSFNSFGSSNSSEIVVINNKSFSDLIGKMDFTNLSLGEKEQDKLKSYEVYIYNKDDLNTILYDSGEQFPQAINSINQKIEYLFQDDTYYQIKIDIVTSNNYRDTIKLNFFVSTQYKNYDKISDSSQVECTLEEEDGRVRVQLTNINETVSSTSENWALMFRRSSDINNYSYWQDIQCVDLSFLHKIVFAKVKDFYWYDYTIESGYIYKYGVQKIFYNKDGSENRRGPLKIMTDFCMADLEDSFLTTFDKQLKIKFNPQISNFSKEVVENKVDTIGSKYPYFYRNAKVGYKTFSISGLIHSFIDENYTFLSKNNYKLDEKKNIVINDSYFNHNNNEIFTNEDNINFNKKEIYGNSYENFIKNEENIDDDRNYNYEKKFRDRVIEFLSDGKPKLFRSATEGNIIVRLTKPSFTPNQTLGRLVYSFSATAYEIDESTLANYIFYDIHNLNYKNYYYDNYKYIDNDLKHIGELIFNIDNGSNVRTLIEQDCAFVRRIEENGQYFLYSYSLNNIDWIDFSFPTSNPYDETGKDESTLLYEENSQIFKNEGTIEDNNYIGHVISINDSDIIIPQYRSYFISKEDVKDNVFSSILIPIEKNDSKNIKILYKATLKRELLTTDEEKLKSQIEQMYLKVGVSQLWGRLSLGEDIINKIITIHKRESKKTFSEILKIRKLYLEGSPGACFESKDINNTINRYILNSTGQLELSYGEASLDNFSFRGFILYQSNNPINMHEQEYYYLKDKFFENIEEIENPKNNYVYNINNKKQIYYLGHWCNFEEIDDSNLGLAKYEDEVIIYYLYNLQKGEKVNDTR